MSAPQFTSSGDDEHFSVLAERIRALPQELIDIIQDHLYDYYYDDFPKYDRPTVDSSFRIPIVLQLNSALRKKYTPLYYGTNTFVIPDYTFCQKWCKLVSLPAGIYVYMSLLFVLPSTSPLWEELYPQEGQRLDLTRERRGLWWLRDKMILGSYVRLTARPHR